MLHALHLEDAGVPVYVQIRDQLLRAIGVGDLAPGEQLPTMRQVAVALKVDLNTVRRAYSELENAGAIVIVRARGTYVAEHPPPYDAARHAERTAQLAMQVLGMAKSAGIDPLALNGAIARLIEEQRRRS